MAEAGVTSPPDWYTSALARRPHLDHLDIDGTRVALRIWGDIDADPVILIHGGAANAAWWDHIAPLLDGHRVVAPDLSGHGNSGWRTEYRMRSWSDEIIALVRSEHIRGKPTVVGHSMGGLIGYATARSFGSELAGLLLVDSHFPMRGDAASARWRGTHPRRVYNERAAIIGRFRLLPPSDARAPYTLDHVAQESIIEVPDGWSWKFDPRLFDHDGYHLESVVPLVDCPAAVVRGDLGLLSPPYAQTLSRAIGADHAITIVDCGHHVPLEQPIALAAAIAAGANAWTAPHCPNAPARPPATIGGP